MTEFISREYGQKEFEIIIKTDCKEHYDAALNFARGLIAHAKSKTYADRIRAMSDEELAKLIYSVDGIGWCKSLPECVKQIGLIPEEKCIGCALEWLKQPAEERA